MNQEFAEGEHVTAQYQTCGLGQYDDNPLIAALPAILSEEEAVQALARHAPYDPKHRKLPAQLRQHALLPILQFFQPLSHHIDLEGKISRMIRFGYTARNPIKQVFYQNVRDRSERIGKTVLPPTITSSTILGTSGTGKTTAVRRILNLYTQVIQHTQFQKTELNHKQLVWLTLECPFDGSVKGICRQFFEKVDTTKLEGRRLKLLAMNSPHPKNLIRPHQKTTLELHLERIQWALKQLERKSIKYRDFCKLAGIRHGILKFPELDEIARKIVNQHNSKGESSKEKENTLEVFPKTRKKKIIEKETGLNP